MTHTWLPDDPFLLPGFLLCSAAFSPSLLLCYSLCSVPLSSLHIHSTIRSPQIIFCSHPVCPPLPSLIFYLWSLYTCILLWQINTRHRADVLFWQCLVISRQKKPRDAGCLTSSLKSHPFLLLSAMSLCLAKIEHVGNQAASVRRWTTTYHGVEDNAWCF